MLDITRCQDLMALQTLICISLFLMSTARMATAHTYISLAVASAMRQGLHCQIPLEEPISDHERDMRRRIFWTVTRLDLYTSAVLGLPPMIKPGEVDMLSASFIEREFQRALRNISSNYEYQVAASAKHLELLMISTRTIQLLYARPGHPAPAKLDTRTMSVSHTKITELEDGLRKWRESAAPLLHHEGESVAVKT